jgi:hypothetical protein
MWTSLLPEPENMLRKQIVAPLLVDGLAAGLLLVLGTIPQKFVVAHKAWRRVNRSDEGSV